MTILLRCCMGGLTTAILLVTIGCGPSRPKTATVQGKVTYKGKPVHTGTINFVPANGTSATGQIAADGSYRLKTFTDGDGAILGSHRVYIVAMDEKNQVGLEAFSPLPPPIVPLKYTSLSTSDLTAEVKDEPNTFNFDLVDPVKKR